MKICKVKDCGKKMFAKGYCNSHYCNTLRHNGNPIAPLRKIGGISPKGYFRIKINGKHFHIHRLVMEKKLGRKLLPSEFVHHIDGNKLNNAPKNLLLTNIKEHLFHHRKVFVVNGKKQCTQCKEWKPVEANFSFCKSEQRWQRWCKACQKIHDHIRYLSKY